MGKHALFIVLKIGAQTHDSLSNAVQLIPNELHILV